ncbi:hypothetical protein SLEP1_g44794 [Rubroshorea leprosula]|uniref:Uncharacterized protein n=1 Tax=Rubroshorea leprosula TaxID=152421 RepID=A0AAV5LIJ6_9ROSI|nr:hypothetical protein SLEP1_g44794 [Rubroshorea leprosula]
MEAKAAAAALARVDGEELATVAGAAVWLGGSKWAVVAAVAAVREAGSNLAIAAICVLKNPTRVLTREPSSGSQEPRLGSHRAGFSRTQFGFSPENPTRVLKNLGRVPTELGSLVRTRAGFSTKKEKKKRRRKKEVRERRRMIGDEGDED